MGQSADAALLGVPGETRKSPGGFCANVPSRWKWLPVDMLSSIPLVLGMAFFKKCPGVPELTLLELLFGCIGLSNALVKFFFNLQHNHFKQDHGTASQMLSHVLTFLQFGMACALASETWPQVAERWSDGGPGCVKTAFQCGFYTGTINIVVIGLIYITVAVISLTRRMRQPAYFTV